MEHHPHADEQRALERAAFWGLALLAPLMLAGPKLWMLMAPLQEFSFHPLLLRASLFLGLSVAALAMASLKMAARKRALFLGLFFGWQALILVCCLAEFGGSYYAYMMGEPLGIVALKQLLEGRTRAMVSNVVSPLIKTVTLLCVLLIALLPQYMLWRGAPALAPRWRARTWGILGALCALCALYPYHPTQAAAAAFSHSTTFVLARQSGHLFDGSMMPAGSARDPAKQARITPREGAPTRDVVLIFLESTRRDALTLYQPSLATSPVLAELAKTSTVFDNAYAVFPSTSKAIIATLCGVMPYPGSSYMARKPGGLPQTCLPQLLGEVGYESLFIHSSWGMLQYTMPIVENMGFSRSMHREEVDGQGFEEINHVGWEERSLLAPVQSWLEQLPDNKPMLLTLLTLAPHHDYHVPSGWLGDFHEDEERNRYLSNVRYVDSFIGELVEVLKQQGRWENTVFVVVSDHGESFGEHGPKFHINVMHQEAMNIAMMVREPAAGGSREPGVVSQLDLLPTLVAMSGHELVGGEYHGADMRLLGEHARPLYFFCLAAETQCLARLEWPMKFIYHFDLRPPELYDLSKDPLEQRDLYTGPTPQTRALTRDVLEHQQSLRRFYGAP